MMAGQFIWHEKKMFFVSTAFWVRAVRRVVGVERG